MTIVQLYDVEDMQRAVRQRRMRDAVGRALGRAYPGVNWAVTVPEDASVVQFYAPALTQTHGMTLHATNDTPELERKAVRFGGEYLERFRVSREAPDVSHVPRDARGAALGQKRGEI